MSGSIMAMRPKHHRRTNMDNEAREIAEDHAVAAGMKDLIRQATARNPRPHIPGAKAMSDLKERLRSHMGKQDMHIVLADCREAADRIEQLEAALRASQEAMESAFAAPDELKFSVKSMNRFVDCIANNRTILGDTQ